MTRAKLEDEANKIDVAALTATVEHAGRSLREMAARIPTIVTANRDLETDNGNLRVQIERASEEAFALSEEIRVDTQRHECAVRECSDHFERASHLEGEISSALSDIMRLADAIKSILPGR